MAEPTRISHSRRNNEESLIPVPQRWKAEMVKNDLNRPTTEAPSDLSYSTESPLGLVDPTTQKDP